MKRKPRAVGTLIGVEGSTAMDRFNQRVAVFLAALVFMASCRIRGEEDKGDKGKIVLYDPKRDKVAGGTVTCIAFSADGSRVAAADIADSVKVWDAATGKLLLLILPSRFAVRENARIPESYDGFSARTQALAFSPDGKKLAGAGWSSVKGDSLKFQGEVRVWDLPTGKAVLTLPHALQRTYSVAFSPDGKVLAAGAPTKVFVWNAETGKEISAFDHEKTGLLNLHPVAFSPDGKQLASGGQGAVKVWDLTAKREILTLKHENLFAGVSFSPDGKRLAASMANVDEAQEAVMVWDLATGMQALLINGATAMVHDVHYSSDGKRLGVAMGFNHFRNPDPGGTVKIWDAATGKEIYQFKQKDSFSCSALAPDGKRIAVGEHGFSNIVQILKIPD
jgi:WD40 repeat protein